MSTEIYYAGIEGGGSHSSLVIADKNGKSVVQIDSGPLNIFQTGFEASASRIITLYNEACTKLESRPISLGLCLSGALGDGVRSKFLETLHAFDAKFGPVLPATMFLASDAEGSLATIFGDDEGMILISGTGSCGMLSSSGGKLYKAGGWGHLMGGDHGSAFWIAQQAIIKSLNADEGTVDLPSDQSIDFVWTLVKQHFDIKEPLDILPDFYSKDGVKPHIASFTKLLALETVKSQDKFALSIFDEAGWWLGRHIVGCMSQYVEDQGTQPECLQVFAAGSVWNSIDLLKGGILSALQDAATGLKSVTFYRSSITAAMGAAYLGQKTLPLEQTMKYDYSNYRDQICKIELC